MTTIRPVLLAGGSGTRLWPLSRKSYPKQFSNIIGDETLFQSCAQRLTSSDILEFAPHMILSNSDFRFIVREQLQELGIDPDAIIIEPKAKNTAAAILAATLFSKTIDEDEVLLVAPSDHVIGDSQDFHEAIKIALSHVQSGKIATFGITPTHPETAYGYLELSENLLDDFGTASVKNFVEKPDSDRAESMFSADNFLWNAGIFLYRAKDMVEAFKAHAPNTLDLVKESISKSSKDLGFVRLAAEPWSLLDDISIDFAIMEKAQNLVAVPYTSEWSDLGGWQAIWSESEKDLDGNALSSSAHAINCTNSLLRSESAKQQIVGIGLDGIVAVAMPDAVLVARKDRADDVKAAVSILQDNEISQATIFPKDYRPWGWFESLTLGDKFQVKRICVKPGASLSLQSHKHRSEHWVVVDGVAKVTVNEEVKLVHEGQSIYVPLGAKHRLENPEPQLMIIIEIQIGNYLGEDDIIRYEDRYERS